jgi:hypothetical protein
MDRESKLRAGIAFFGSTGEPFDGSLGIASPPSAKGFATWKAVLKSLSV